MTDPSVPKTPKKKPINVKKKPFPLFLIISIISLLIVLVNAFFLTTLWQRQQANLPRITKLTDSLQTILSNQEKTNENIQQQTQMQTKLKTQLAQLAEKKIDGQKLWELAEIQFAVRLAGYQLQINHSPENAIKLLAIAAKRLSSLNVPSLATIQAAIEHDLEQLKSAEPIKISEILTKLDTAVNQVQDLNIKLLASQKKEASVQMPQETTKLSLWQRLLKTIQKSLKGLVIIHHHADQSQAFISPNEQRYQQQLILLALSQAKWALLREDEKLYRSSIQEAIASLNKYFTRVPSAASIIDALDQLKGARITPSFPDLAMSLSAIEKALENTTATSN